MADNKKLYEDAPTKVDAQSMVNDTAIPDLGLIEKKKSADAEKIKAERLEALRYAEQYRQKLRIEREAKKAPQNFVKQEEEIRRKSERERELDAFRENELERAREDSDRVRELLMRINAGVGNMPSDDQKEEVTLTADAAFGEKNADFDNRGENFSDTEVDFVPLAKEHKQEELVQDNLVSVDMDLRSDVLHIEGMSLGEITVGHNVVNERVISVDHKQTVREPLAVSREAYSSTMRQDATQYYEPIKVGSTAYPEPSYENDDYEPIVKKHTGKKEVTDASVYTLNTTAYDEKEATRDAFLGAKTRYDADNEDVGDLYLNSEFDVRSAYPEPEREYVTRGGKLGHIDYDKALDIEGLDVAKRLAYPDPEAPLHNDPNIHIDDTLEEPLPDVPKREVVLTRKEKRERARALRELEHEDMLSFEKMSRENARFVPTDIKIESEDIDTPGLIYPDPDYLTDEPVVYAEGEVVSKNHKREALLQYNDFYGKEYKPSEYAEEKEAPVINKRKLKKLVKKSRALDLLAVEEGYESRMRALRLELQSAELRFDAKKDKGARTAREIQREIAKLEREKRRALSVAAADNERSYTPVLTDYTVARLKKGASRERLVELRGKLLDELANLSEVNERLVSVYTGKENGSRAHFEGRVMAEMRAKRRAYRKQRGLDKAIVRYHISYSFSKRLYALMDEYVNLSGEIARLEYSLKHERLLRSVKKDMKKECRKLRRRLLRVSDHIDYYERRAIEEADDRREVKRKMIVGWTVLIAIVALGLAVWAFWEPFTAYIAEIYGGGM